MALCEILEVVCFLLPYYVTRPIEQFPFGALGTLVYIGCCVKRIVLEVKEEKRGQIPNTKYQIPRDLERHYSLTSIFLETQGPGPNLVCEDGGHGFEEQDVVRKVLAHPWIVNAVQEK
ncbi:hypothetical protein BU23DRAFT_597769 [Bimuria novae-zelandiae CBS 107.79]|uniref:Uncharacterized protein n=1 Tax=Bimuria novae-zelandiae CBS 107.79 TaxID=1447943 RepID=A0A6A5VFK2_9PLEO|nr:hypothetical protein BU23DRAFT_597769 [Bimuria novae-zelandiae CBS 107.79]